MKIAILYAFHQFNEHVQFFLKHGVLPNYEYFFIYQGDEQINFPYPDRLLQRENIGYDFGGWSVQLFQRWGDELVKDSFDYYIFINSSVTGPFLPIYHPKQDWPMIFITMLNETVLLSGITINCDKWIYKGDLPAHIQTMLFCMHSDTLQYLINRNIFNPTKFITDKQQLVCECEVRMSQLIFEKGGDIACLMKIYDRVRFNGQTIKFRNGDPWYNNSVHGDTLHPYETIFFKNNRRVNPGLLARYMKYHDELL